jgi:Na+/melibiose symporter-like transporter
MDNTMKMIAASVGTAILVTVMTMTAESANNRPDISYPDMYGANMAFMVVSVLSLIGLILSFFIKNERQKEEDIGNRQRKIKVKMQE